MNEEKNILRFSKIKFENVYGKDYEDFQKNNVINFGEKNFVALYAPNGTGKTCLTKAIKAQIDNETNNKKKKEEFIKVEYNQSNSCSEIFHIIADQNNRNIIQKEDSTYCLSDNQKKEEELLKCINEQLELFFTDKFKKILYEDFNVESKTSPLFNFINDNDVKNFLLKIRFSGSAAIKVKLNEFYNFFKKLSSQKEEQYDKFLYEFFIFDNSKNGMQILNKILELNKSNFMIIGEVEKIEENNVATKVLKKFKDKNRCIVCDEPKIIDPKKILEEKEEKLESKINEIKDDKLKEIIKIIFKGKLDIDEKTYISKIKEVLIEVFENNNYQKLIDFQEEIKKIISTINIQIINKIIDIVEKSNFLTLYKDYNKVCADKIDITDSFDLIKEIVQTCMKKNILIEKDDKGFSIKLDENIVDGIDRNKLQLSSGEQNFLSLAFEIVKAKVINKQVIVIDDPISSFDSIYKNKIIFLISFLLKEKHTLILTHNMDTLYLLELEYNLYIFNNVFDGNNNGFISIDNVEKEFLIHFDKCTEFFRRDVKQYIKNEKIFYISMIPFLRGYIKIVYGNNKNYSELSSLMHGYEDESKKVNIQSIYDLSFNPLDDNNNIKNEIFLKEILEIDLINISEIIDGEKYPLLNKTLYCILSFLVLRLKVEKLLCTKYKIKPCKDDFLTTGKIINRAFPRDNESTKKWRVSLFSKKCLINEFNHFDGNINIFQPAIDISLNVLKDEINSVNAILDEIENKE